jgi:hypothetical protein
MYRNGNAGTTGNNSKNGVPFKKTAVDGRAVNATSEGNE